MSESGNQATVSTPRLMLAAARKARGLEIADVARQLKLSVSQIEALEAGNFDKLPGPVFARGFMRNYARLLKIDPEAVLSSVDLDTPLSPLDGTVPPSHDIPMPSEQAPSRWPRYLIALLLVLAGLVVYEFYLNDGTSVEEKPARTIASPAISSATVPLLPIQPGTGTLTAAADPAVSAPAPAVTAAESKQQPQSAGGAAAAEVVHAEKAVADTRDQPSTQGEHELRLQFKKDSWVEILDRSGKVLMSRINRPGAEQRLSGLPPFSLIIGNASGVRLTHNDKIVDLLQHSRDDVARFTLK